MPMPVTQMEGESDTETTDNEITEYNGMDLKRAVVKLERMESGLIARLLDSLPRRSRRIPVKAAAEQSDDDSSEPEIKPMNLRETRKLSYKEMMHQTDSENSDNKDDEMDNIKDTRSSRRANFGRRCNYAEDGSRKRTKTYENDEEDYSGFSSSSEDASDDSDTNWNNHGVKKRKKKKIPRELRPAKTKYGNGKNTTKDKHQERCWVCRLEGEIVCCRTCPHAYHLLCLNPPLRDVPNGCWMCPRCSTEPLPDKATEIFSWRWVESKKERQKYMRLSKEKRKYEARPMREYLVHIHEHSYWNCMWVREDRLDVCHPILLRTYIRLQKSQALDADKEYELIGDVDTTDPLYERFYKHGIRPEWLRIDRIVNHQRIYGKTQYLVKWCSVMYSEMSWEDENDKTIPEFEKYQQVYHEWRMLFTGDTGLPALPDTEKFVYKHIEPPPDEPISDLDVPFDEQPRFLGASRGLSLHDYQLDSLNWLRKSWNKGVNTILADEMGLGKTIQAIVFIYSLFKEGHCTGPFLVTAPLTTIPNWEREFKLWAPDFYVVTYTGTLEERMAIRQNDFSYNKSRAIKVGRVAEKIEGPVKFHVLLTSFEFITKDKAALSSIPWSAFILDEAHRLRNATSRFFTNIDLYQCDYKLLLTGTPLQNNLRELFNMLRFLCPDKVEELNLMEDELDNENLDQEDHVRRLKSLLEPLLLRRVKEDVLKDLPTKSELIVKVELSPMQKQYYKFILSKNFDALNSASGGHWATLMFIFVDLQKCCNHPYLFSTAMMEAPVAANDIYETEALVKACGKLSLLQKMLRELKKAGNRVLIFSHSTKMLDIFEDFLQGENHEYERIDGSIVGSDRQDAIDRFNAPNSPQFVFLLSTKAGGLGINLATADTVILYDSDWNPHNDIQAFSRAHRIGQKNKVMVYRLVTRNSVEERIVQVARQKLILNHQILETGKGDFTSGISKSTIDSAIRFGTEELFKKGNCIRDNFTDEAIRDLLDRSQAGLDAKKSLGDISTNDVKVVSYTIEEEEEVIDLVDDSDDSTTNTKPNYWHKLLGPHQAEKPKAANNELQGKRQRKEIDYCDDNILQIDLVDSDDSN